MWKCVTEGAELDFISEEDTDSDDELMALSVQALSGTEGSKTIRLRGHLQGKEVFMLVDLGSTHNFISDQLLPYIDSGQQLQHSVKVQVANGEFLSCTHELPDQLWAIQGHSFHTTLKIIPLQSYDVVLGMDWLELHSPMEVLWVEKWLQFQYQNKLIKLQGILPTVHMGAPVSLQKLQAMDRTDSILYAVQLQAKEENISTSTPLPPELQDLLQQFESVFAPPTALPPERPGDHKIPLLEGAQPFCLRPYRYNCKVQIG